MKDLIFIDCEADGPCPGHGVLTEFGAVSYDLWKHNPDPKYCAFHGILWHAKPDEQMPVMSRIIDTSSLTDQDRLETMVRFNRWLGQFKNPKMVSDNPAYDFQWINHALWHYLGRSPLGHSARRISDFYAGLTGDFKNTQQWKRLRVTPHDHNPVNDSLGNVEAFNRMLKGERA